jgi:hypothetical protein
VMVVPGFAGASDVAVVKEVDRQAFDLALHADIGGVKTGVARMGASNGEPYAVAQGCGGGGARFW